MCDRYQAHGSRLHGRSEAGGSPADADRVVWHDDRGNVQNPKAGYNGVVLDVPGGGAQWEMLEPDSDDSYLVKFLKEGGSALHHITFQVENVDVATTAMEEFGCKPFGGRVVGKYKEV